MEYLKKGFKYFPSLYKDNFGNIFKRIQYLNE
jgi:hypothetical protein